MRIGVRENALENLNELKDAYIERSFFAQLAANSLDQGFAELEGAAGNGPLALERLTAAADEQHAALEDDHATHADYGVIRKFALASHRPSAVRGNA